MTCEYPKLGNITPCMSILIMYLLFITFSFRPTYQVFSGNLSIKQSTGFELDKALDSVLSKDIIFSLVADVLNGS